MDNEKTLTRPPEYGGANGSAMTALFEQIDLVIYMIECTERHNCPACREGARREYDRAKRMWGGIRGQNAGREHLRKETRDNG